MATRFGYLLEGALRCPGLEGCFKPVLRDTWPACNYSSEIRLVLVVYVDDFRLSGSSTNIREGWKRLRQGLDLDDPEPSGLYLGCKHERFQVGPMCVGVSYNMESLFSGCIELYLQLIPSIGGLAQLRDVATPFPPRIPERCPCQSHTSTAA